VLVRDGGRGGKEAVGTKKMKLGKVVGVREVRGEGGGGVGGATHSPRGGRGVVPTALAAQVR